MITDPSIYLTVLVAGAFTAAFVIGAVGFADALILNSFWLHVMEPAKAIPLVVCCGLFMHIVPLFKLRKTLDFSNLPRFAFAGLLGVPLGVWVLSQASPTVFKTAIGVLLLVYGLWMLLRPNATLGNFGGIPADIAVGFSGGFMGGYSGLSGLLPTLWVGARNWSKNTQRGVFQPFVLIMHALGIVTFAFNGMLSSDTLYDLALCLPVIALGSWLGVKVFPYINENQFKRIILGLVLVSGITLLI